MKNKLDTLEFLMSNDKTSKIIKEAFNSPIGSTKRERAKAILSILKRASGEDGKGSAANFEAYNRPEEKKKEYGFESYIVFPYVPDPNEDGQGDASSYMENLKNTTLGGPLVGAGEKIGSAFQKAGSTIGSGLSSALDRTASIYKIPGQMASSAYNVLPEPVKELNMAVYGYDPKTGLKIGETPTKTTSTPTKTTGLGTQENVTYGYDPSVFKIEGATGETTGETVGETAGEESTEAGDLKTLYDNLVNSDYSLKKVENPTTNEELLYNLAVDAISKNTGSELFASSVLGNKDYATLFPGAEDFFGKSLADAKKETSDLLKKEYGVDELKNEVLNITKRNSTLKTDATNYIKGKDEYVKALDAKLNEANDRFLSGDVSDPALQKSYENYKNYLTVLKGRQEQSYQDYLQQTIDMASSELQTLSNSYTSAVNAFNEAITSENASTEEQYNNIKTALTGMYTSLEAAENTNMTKAMNYLTLAQSNLNMLKLLDGSGISYTPEEESDLHDLAKTALTTEIKVGTNTINIPKPTINLYDEISSRDASAARIFLDEYSSALQNYISSGEATPEGIDSYKTQISSLSEAYPTVAGNLYNILSGSTATASDKKVINSKFDSIISKLGMYLSGKAGGAFGSGILAGEYNSDRLIKDLVAIGLGRTAAEKLAKSFAPYIGTSGMIESIKNGGASSLITTINTYAE